MRILPPVLLAGCLVEIDMGLLPGEDAPRFPDQGDTHRVDLRTDGGTPDRGPRDEGTPPDEGEPPDEGTPLDEGEPPDKGTPPDKGEPPDSTPPDKGAPPDKTPPPDTSPKLDKGGPVVVFYDDFEATLGKWTLSGTGDPWTTTSSWSAKGSKSAMAQGTGSGKDSFITASFTAPGGGTLTLEYQRRLMGLDGIDDFQVEVGFSGTWITLEHIGSAKGNDGTFIPKSFTIPSTSDAIRFKCECGAASERCVVDEVKVTATP